MVLAFDGLLNILANPATSWVFIPILALLIPVVSELMGPVRQRMRAAERREARQTYERIALEKLEVLKAGITMGYSQQELKELDERLERLIGEDQLKKLLDPVKVDKRDRQMELLDRDDIKTAVKVGTIKQKV